MTKTESYLPALFENHCNEELKFGDKTKATQRGKCENGCNGIHVSARTGEGCSGKCFKIFQQINTTIHISHCHTFLWPTFLFLCQLLYIKSYLIILNLIFISIPFDFFIIKQSSGRKKKVIFFSRL